MRHRCTQNGAELWETHTETCGICRVVLPALLFLPSSAALEARARGTSGAKERLAGVPSRRKNNSQGRHKRQCSGLVAIPKETRCVLLITSPSFSKPLVLI